MASRHSSQVAVEGPGEGSAGYERGGLTLLEVLVAGGILVVGLASVAAVMPAASSRLGQAVQQDRSVVMAANAYAECLNRRLVAADMFSAPTKACVFGTELQDVPGIGSGGTFTAAANAGVLAARIGTDPVFTLQDDLVFGGGGDVPTNVFDPPASGNRSVKPGVCWGGMITCSGSAAPGASAILSIAVFKKDGGPPKSIPLTGANGIFRMGTANEADLKKYLPGCSYVLALPSGGGGSTPRWFRINSSWKMHNSPACMVSFADNAGLAAFAGSSPTVIAFEHLMQVDQYAVRLD